jgi:hypothetical protein
LAKKGGKKGEIKRSVEKGSEMRIMRGIRWTYKPYDMKYGAMPDSKTEERRRSGGGAQYLYISAHRIDLTHL